MSYEDSIGVVLDTGSQWLKAGFAAESFPRAVFPSAVGRFRCHGLVDGVPDIYCGQEAVLKRGVSRLTWPVREGEALDWDDLEKLWYHTFYKELLVAPEEARVMHAVHPLIPGANKEKMVEILFETFIVHSLYLAPSPALVVYASGRTTGVVWESGFSSCYAAPVFEGFPLKHSIVSSPLTGEAMTKGLQALLYRLGYSFTTAMEIELLEKIKAEICYVAADYESELASRMCEGDTKVRYALPDGQHVMLDEERFQCPEVLFRPSLQNFKCRSIVDDICKSISTCDVDYQAILYNNIVIAGGASKFSGLEKRLLHELSLRTVGQTGFRVSVDAMGSREYAAWTGGAMLASLDIFKGCWMTRKEYEDLGAERISVYKHYTRMMDTTDFLDKPPVVIDYGSYSIKAGYACDNHPVSIFRTAVGRPKYLNGSYGREPYDVYIGDHAMARAEDLDICRPVEKGMVVHWDNMERVLHYTLYTELRTAPECRAVMLACAPTSTLDEKMKFCEVIFETLNVPAFCVQSQSVLSLYGCGYTTGLCVDLGYATADISPVYEGGLMSYAKMTNHLPSSAIANYLKEMLARRGIHVTCPDVLDDIRNTKVYVTKNAAISRKNYRRTYTLPDGQVIDVSNEAFMAGELMFQPDLVEPERTGITSVTEAAITAGLKCDPELRAELYNAVVPCGGMAMMPGLCARLQIDLEYMIHRPVNVITSDEAYATSWLGGATFAGMTGSRKMWVTQRQYEDFGYKIVKNKFM